jgi:epoxyqueuosine reductase
MIHTQLPEKTDPHALLAQLRVWATALGFSQIGVADIDLSTSEAEFADWLEQGLHGSMHYLAAHGLKRSRPAELVPGTRRVITARMNYLPRSTRKDWQSAEWQQLQSPAQGVVSVYARGRDYHKVLRTRLQKLAEQLQGALGTLGYRVFTDSAPVMEVELAARSGLGWRGKHTLALHREHGSMFFLGEIYIDYPLPLTAPTSAHCGSCTACIDICPTQAILAPGKLDARRCISYLTIEHPGPIPPALRPLIGNRIYGCDDCQLICPWNKYAQTSTLPDFDARPSLTHRSLLDLWSWSASDFLKHTEGSPIRRIGFERWQRNLAVALGNALQAPIDASEKTAIRAALTAQQAQASPLVSEHIAWALQYGISIK